MRLIRLSLAVVAGLTALWAFLWVGTRPLRQQGDADRVRLTILHWGDRNEDAIVARLVQDFESLNPDIQIIRTNVGSPAQLATKLQTMLAAGDPPDAFYLESERLADLASKGLLADIEAFIRADEEAEPPTPVGGPVPLTCVRGSDSPPLTCVRGSDSPHVAADVSSAVIAGAADEYRIDLSDFFTPVVDAFRYDGQRVGRGTLYGLPKDFTTVGFYYNKDLFRRAGLPLPPRGLAVENGSALHVGHGGPTLHPNVRRGDPTLHPDVGHGGSTLHAKEGWTWDEFIEAARAIGRLPGCYGADFVTWEAMIRIYLFTYGLDLASPGFTEFYFTDPAVIDALARLRSWFHDEERTLLSAKTQLETGQEPFLAGNIGMAGPYGRWKVPTYRHIRDFDWDFAPLPHAAGGAPANGVLTVAWAMSARCKHPQETWRLLKYLCSPRGQELICEQGLAIPVLRSVAYSPCFSDPDQKPENDDAFLEAAEYASYIEWPGDPRYRDQLKIHLENIFKLGRPVEPMLAGVQAAWESNQTPTIFRAHYRKVPWSTVTAGILIPLGLLLAVGGVLWWRRRPGQLSFHEELAGLTAVSPWIIGFVVFTAFPIVLSLLLAFTRWSGLLTLGQAEWVGLDNFRELLGYDRTFRRALYVTALYALLAVPSSQIAALGAALLLNHEFRGIGVFRAIWYLPSVLAGVGLAIMWKWVFHHEHGLLNALLAPVLAWFDATPPRWFERDAYTWGVPAFALINLWVIGGTMMIYLAGLKGIPRELYEAAEIDGAGARRRFWHVTLPMLSPVVFFNVVIAIIASFQIFTQVFVMTGGGPGEATHFYVFYVYKRAFDLHDMGYASALAWLLLLIVLGLTLLVMRGSRRYVYYEALRT